MPKKKSTKETAISIGAAKKYAYCIIAEKSKKRKVVEMKNMVNVVFDLRRDDYRAGYAERLNNPKEYLFAAYEDLETGDVVVVDTKNGFTLATVTGTASRIPRNIPMGEIKEVVCKVDFTAFNDRKERKEKRKELKAEMDKRVEALKESAVYEMMAEKDPDLKKLLEAFKGLGDE